MKLQKIISIASCFSGGLLFFPVLGASGLLGTAFSSNVFYLYLSLLLCIALTFGGCVLAGDGYSLNDLQLKLIIAGCVIIMTLVVGYQPWSSL